MTRPQPRIIVAMQCRGEDEANQLLFAPACWCDMRGCPHYPDCAAAGGRTYEPLIRLCLDPDAPGQLIPRCYSYQPSDTPRSEFRVPSSKEVSHAPS